MSLYLTEQFRILERGQPVNLLKSQFEFTGDVYITYGGELMFGVIDLS